jgi:hypothetical protein
MVGLIQKKMTALTWALHEVRCIRIDMIWAVDRNGRTMNAFDVLTSVLELEINELKEQVSDEEITKQDLPMSTRGSNNEE